eukprot:NODE_3782_length_743_cov_219.696221.p2 GENE.NODE_3782_length_743_cov_219.696221~~NODE_3782_length_743_cov_219.696221.p2  ORF type:complete len:161 (-),score=49.48 NODE_3782_length_743_cov_219.696221:246-728(-)
MYNAEYMGKNHSDQFEFFGFHDDPSSGDHTPAQTWADMVIERAGDHRRRIAVLICNKQHQEYLKEIRRHCITKGWVQPRAIMVTRAVESEIDKECGITQAFITKDWGWATHLAFEEMGRLLDVKFDYVPPPPPATPGAPAAGLATAAPPRPATTVAPPRR